MKEKYCRQKYLLETNYGDIRLQVKPISRQEYVLLQDFYIPYNLFDCNDLCVRKIDTSFLDASTDTLYDFERVVEKMADIDELVIVDDRPDFTNPIIRKYAYSTMKAYVLMFNQYGIKSISVRVLEHQSKDMQAAV